MLHRGEKGNFFQKVHVAVVIDAGVEEMAATDSLREINWKLKEEMQTDSN